MSGLLLVSLGDSRFLINDYAITRNSLKKKKQNCQKTSPQGLVTFSVLDGDGTVSCIHASQIPKSWRVCVGA